MFTALKTGDEEQIKQYINIENIIEKNETEEDRTSDNQDMEKTMLKNLNYEVVSTDVKINECTIKLNVSNKNLKTVFGNYISKAFSVAFSQAFGAMTEEEMDAQLKQYFEEQYNSENIETVTTEVTINMKKENGKWKITNKDGSVNTELSYDDITDINNDCVTIENNGKFGIIGTDKSEKVKAEYQYLKCVFSNYYIAEKDNKYGVINIQNEAVIPFEYKSIEFDKDADCLKATKSEDDKIYLIDRNMEIKLTGTNMTVRDGYIRMNVDNQYKLVNLKFEEKSNRDAFPNNTLFTAKNDGKYGLVNKDGTLVVQYQYDDITEQNEYGFVAVKKDGKWGVIDQYGNTIVDPKYEFSDISKITVLGKWHSTEGINTAYFICE